MKKLILSLTIGLAMLSTSVLAGGTNTYFNANELSISLGTSYALEKTGKQFQTPYSINADVGAQYFFTRYLGLDADMPFYSSKGTSISSAKAGLVARLPIGFVAPYVGLAANYDWSGDKFQNVEKSKFSYAAKAGLEVRANKHVGVFVEDVYQNNTIQITKGGGQNTLHGGIRFAL